MMWEKLGNIYHPKCKNKFLFSHAASPLALPLDNTTCRVFYNGRDKENRSSLSFFDFDMTSMKVVYDHPNVVATFGDPHSYYSHGLSNGCFLQLNNSQLLLFMGWQMKEGEHWRGDIGAMELTGSGNNAVVWNKPFLSCDNETDKVSLSYPYILKEQETYKLWYGSTISWASSNGEMIHVINYAESNDARSWIRKGIAIPYELGVAQAFSRPSVLKSDNNYYMWYSFRPGDGTAYRIGYAKSEDGNTWIPHYKDSGISVSPDGWDSEMICYPYVLKFNGEIFMFYNGNGYGKTGIGLAKLKGIL